MKGMMMHMNTGNRRDKSKGICLLRVWIPAILAGAILLSGCAGNKTDKDTETEPSAVTFEATDIEGNQFSSDIFSDTKLTMINVWATYCNPCLQEMPALGELSREYDSKEFQIIGVISDVQEGADQDTIDKASGLIEQTGADYPHLILNESLYKAMLTEVTAVPATFFFNDQGMLLDTIVGSRNKDKWKETIDALLEKQ